MPSTYPTSVTGYEKDKSNDALLKYLHSKLRNFLSMASVPTACVYVYVPCLDHLCMYVCMCKCMLYTDMHVHVKSTHREM